MKKYFHAICAFLLLCLIKQTVLASSVITYRDDRFGFEISYLNNWEQSRAPGNPAFFIKRKSATNPDTISINVANFTGDKETITREIKAHPERLLTVS